jgi:hypothetical protein
MYAPWNKSMPGSDRLEVKCARRGSEEAKIRRASKRAVVTPSKYRQQTIRIKQRALYACEVGAKTSEIRWLFQMWFSTTTKTSVHCLPSTSSSFIFSYGTEQWWPTAGKCKKQHKNQLKGRNELKYRFFRRPF